MDELTPLEVPRQITAKDIWDSYDAAYKKRYGRSPLHEGGKTGTILKRILGLFGDDAPAIAAWFVWHPNQRYVVALHPISLLSQDAAALSTQFHTGRTMTMQQARDEDRLADVMPEPDEQAEDKRNCWKMIKLAAEATGTTLSKEAMQAIARRIFPYGETVYRQALAAAADNTTKGCFCLAAVLAEIHKLDGHPSPEEAWAIMMPVLLSEDASACVTTAMMLASEGISQMLLYGDRFGASKAFLAKYTGELEKARQQGMPARWQITAGHDKNALEFTIQRAVEAGKINQAAALHLLPDRSSEARHLLLTGNPLSEHDKTNGRRNVAAILEMLGGKK